MQSGQTLTAETGSWLGWSWTEWNTLSYAYQWQSCDPYGSDCEDIPGATGSSYTLSSGNIGHSIRIVTRASVTYSEVVAVSTVTQPITGAIAPTVEIPPVVSGSGLVGYTLNASPGTWSGEEPISYGYQWERCKEGGYSCSAISGATSNSYTLSESDAASTVRVLVTATDAGSNATEAVSLPLTVSATELLNVIPPSISGNTQIGQRLNADPGIWTGDGAIGYTYQWERCNEAGESCSVLVGATESFYAPVGGDVGLTLKVVVTGSGTSGTKSASSAVTSVIGSESIAPENSKTPSIEGYPTVGETLTIEPGLWSGTEPISYEYEWQTCNSEGEECTKITGETAKTYVLPESEIGSTVRASVTAYNSAGSESSTSDSSGLVEALTSPKDTESPVIQGIAEEGAELFATNGEWVGAQPLHYYYQWERCDSNGESCTNIEGATKSHYTPESGDVGSTLRMKVTVSNTVSSVSTASNSVLVANTTEATVTKAIEIAEVTDPSILAPSTPATLEEQVVKPAISDAGEVISSSSSLTSSTISKETPGEFAVNTADGMFSLTPLNTSPRATTTPAIVNSTVAAFAETTSETDTFVRASALGATTIVQLRSNKAPSSFTWEVGIGSDQELQELPDGNIAIVEPTSLVSLESEIPSEALESPESEATEKLGGEGATQETAENELESNLEEEGLLEALPMALIMSTPEVTSKGGELHPQETSTEYESSNSAMVDAEEHTADSTIMVIQVPHVLDASGASVPAALKVEGNIVTLTVSPSGGTIFPVTAAMTVNAPNDKASATKAVGAHYGLSDPNAKPFAHEEAGKFVSNFDPRLASGPLQIKRARLFLNYNTPPNNQRLNEWLEAVKAAGLTPFITLRRCEPIPASYKSTVDVPCPTQLPTLEQYRKDVKKLMEQLINGNSKRPPVRLWGSWNEPDNRATSLHTDPAGSTKAAYLWGETLLAAEEAKCKHRCTVVAGEFQEYGNHHSYIAQYQKTIIEKERKHNFPVEVKPHIWGLHDYKDLEEVKGTKEKGKEVLGGYVNKEARGFVGSTKLARLGSSRVWLTEQGVLLQNNEKTTRLYNKTILQRLAAQDFVRLGRSSEHIEWAYYYLYEGPTEATLLTPHHEHEFDSALLDGEGVKESQEPREAYCVLALGDSEGCPATAVTQDAIASTTTPSAMTVLLNVNPSGLPTEYHIEYGATTAYGHATISDSVSDDEGLQSDSVELTGLDACTTYHYQAVAENDANGGTPSLGGDQTFQTGGCVATAVSQGHRVACVVLSSGEVDCWGNNEEGQLGNGTMASESDVPIKVSGITDATAVGAGLNGACALLTSGEIDCWGANEEGRLGNGTTTTSFTPVTVSGITDATALAVGEDTGCAVLSDHSVKCWGSGSYGQLGDGSEEDALTPVTVSGITDADAIGSGNYNTCALLTDGHVDCWGENSFGRFGDGTETDSTTPVAMSSITDAVSLGVGESDNCVVLDGGSLACAGDDLYGQLGPEPEISTSCKTREKKCSVLPVPIGDVSNAMAVAVSGSTVCALRSSGTVQCWGWGESDSLGDGETENTPWVKTVTGITTATKITGEMGNICALLSGGGVDCWGGDVWGELGDGSDIENSSLPLPVTGLGE